MHPFCLPIQKSSLDEISKEIEKTLVEYPGDYQYFEVWIDLIEGVGFSDLTNGLIRLAEKYPGQLIYLFRQPELAPIKMPLNERLELLQACAKLRADSAVLIDLDIGQQTSELDFIKVEKLNLNLIASYHNYQRTPSNEELLQIIESMEQYNPKIYKLACYCNSEQDCLKLLGLILKLKEAGKLPLVLGMGACGLGTRFIGPLWGNALSFVPKDAAGESAPGQVGLGVMRGVVDLDFT